MRQCIEKYFCDRCGNEILKKPCFYIEINPNTSIQILQSNWKSADLCDICKEEFKKWWKKDE